ncbi:hypothetical protein [Vibrio cincinnatiensis]|uniref:hypothetical protein n=1 Tax=Vibrio cincinnatiensis TaxID=675 RepID=UPI001EDE4642|nr:hypothetical protein [Vibrio cincinnatiensis]
MNIQSSETRVRMLAVEEKQELRRDMQESSFWAKVELKRRRAAKKFCVWHR